MKKLFVFWTLFALVLFVAGCNKWFDPDPDFEPTPEMEEMAKMAQ